MCGRYRLSRRAEAFAKYFDADYSYMEWEARYNIAPTQRVPVILQRQDGTRWVSLIRWGLVPYCAKDPAIGGRMINARSETAADKAAFREPLQRRRCLMPADGFYEWKRVGSQKQPYNFEMKDGSVFAFAGLWEQWRGDNGTVLETCVILTTAPNALLSGVHDRMPAILPTDRYDIWLDCRLQTPARLAELLRPLDASKMRGYPVSTLVNNVANDEPRCSSPVDSAPFPQTSLF